MKTVPHLRQGQGGQAGPLALLLVLTATFPGCVSDSSSPEPGVAPVARESEPARTLPAPSTEALIAAAQQGALGPVKEQIAAGADVNGMDPDRRTALMYAAFDGHTEVVRALLDAGAAIDVRDPDGRHALMYASTGPFGETVELLLERGADPHVTDTGERFTSLMHAAAEGQAGIVAILLRYGADPTAVDTDGDTALDFATQNGHAAVVTLLTRATAE